MEAKIQGGPVNFSGKAGSISTQVPPSLGAAAALTGADSSISVPSSEKRLQVGSDFKMMNLTQAQINVSKMIQARDSEAAKRALETSQKVQSNTMGHVRDQIAKIQQQVHMQKQKAKAEEEALIH